jgi:hypothetical protein
MIAEAATAGANLLTKLIEIPIYFILERPITLKELELSEKLERNQRWETIKKKTLERELLDNENEKYLREQRIKEREDLERQLEQFKEQFLNPPDNYENDKARFEKIFVAGAEITPESISLHEKEMKHKALTDQPKVSKEIGLDGTPPTK